MDPDKYERARTELIEGELKRLEEHLRDSAVQLAHGNLQKAEELLEEAKHSHELAMFHVEKLPVEQSSLRESAQRLQKSLDELERQMQIKKNFK